MTKETKRAVWVLLEVHNDYNQHGEYFCHVFFDEPNLEMLCDYFAKKEGKKWKDVPTFVNFLLHLKNGGGRQGVEDQWWILCKVEEK